VDIWWLPLFAATLMASAAAALTVTFLQRRDPAVRAARRNLFGPPASSDATLLDAQPLPLTPRKLLVHTFLEQVLPSRVVSSVQAKVTAAGVAHLRPVGQVLLAKVVAGASAAVFAGLMLASEVSALTVVSALLAPFLAFNVPDLRLSSKASARREAVLGDLPDALDLMTIMVEAGVSFEAAVVRVGRLSSGVLADELTRTMQEVRAGVPRIEALANLAARCDVADLTAFTSAVGQAEQLGVPVAKVLRVQSGELREKRRQRAEERAMKIPAKVILPLATCILPAMLLVVVGPSVVTIARGFSTFS
jgi:tight adherence protein C